MALADFRLPVRHPIPTPQTLKVIQKAILDFITRSASNSSTWTDLDATRLGRCVESLVDEAFRENVLLERRTPEALLIQVGVLCKQLSISPVGDALEFYQELNGLLRGGRRPMQPSLS
jgi:hypothetical protein